MNYQTLIDEMTPEVYERLRSAVELGRWPDGSEVTPAQREHALQAVIAWGERHLSEAERVGYIDRGSKRDGQLCDDPDEKPLRWLDEKQRNE